MRIVTVSANGVYIQFLEKFQYIQGAEIENENKIFFDKTEV